VTDTGIGITPEQLARLLAFERLVSAPDLTASSAAALPPPVCIQGDPLIGRRVHLVEHGADNQRFITFHLRKLGFVVFSAENGRVGVDLVFAARSPFALFFMDLQMPEIDGYAAASELRARGVQTPVLALTARVMAGDRERCMAAGSDDYFTKPVSRETRAAARKGITQPTRHATTTSTPPLAHLPPAAIKITSDES